MKVKLTKKNMVRLIVILFLLSFFIPCGSLSGLFIVGSNDTESHYIYYDRENIHFDIDIDYEYNRVTITKYPSSDIWKTNHYGLYMSTSEYTHNFQFIRAFWWGQYIRSVMFWHYDLKKRNVEIYPNAGIRLLWKNDLLKTIVAYIDAGTLYKDQSAEQMDRYRKLTIKNNDGCFSLQPE